MNNSAETIYLAPLELANLVPSPEYGIMVILLLLYAGTAPIRVVTNTLVCVTLNKFCLIKISAYRIIFSLPNANVLYCLYFVLFQTTGVIIDQ